MCHFVRKLWLTTIAGSSDGDNIDNSRILHYGISEEAFSCSGNVCSVMGSGNRHTYLNCSLVMLGALILGVRDRDRLYVGERRA